MRALDRVARLKGFIVDLDGTTYLGDTVIPGAIGFFETLRATGRQHLFITNNSSAKRHIQSSPVIMRARLSSVPSPKRTTQSLASLA